MKSGIDNQENDTWGAIGIGAMIVFISLILVAAVASAVIIQTAEKLQQNAQRAGDDTSDELSGKITIMQGFVEDQVADSYTFYVRLAPGSSNIAPDAISWQMYCTTGAGYEFGQLEAADVIEQDTADFGALVGDMEVQEAYKINIEAALCTPTAVDAQDNPVAQLYIHIESGGTTFETITVNSADVGSPVI